MAWIVHMHQTELFQNLATYAVMAPIVMEDVTLLQAHVSLDNLNLIESTINSI